jgi:tetratricopeptide (TPR) repeat protein
VIEVGPGAPLSTPTLAELYLDQGFFAKAVEVYEQILEREPQNERVRARLIEVKALAHTLDAPPVEDLRVAQKRALARKIARLEQMLAAVRRG